jgi:hypothetical protein
MLRNVPCSLTLRKLFLIETLSVFKRLDSLMTWEDK